VSVLVVIVTIVTTDGYQSIISIPGSFAALSDRDITTTTTSDSLKISNLQSSQQYSIVNNSSLGDHSRYFSEYLKKQSYLCVLYYTEVANKITETNEKSTSDGNSTHILGNMVYRNTTMIYL
jgi:hypothetical protein